MDSNDNKVVDIVDKLGDFLPSGVAIKEDIINLISIIIIDELDKFNIFKLDNNILNCSVYWFDISCGKTNLSTEVENCSLNFFLRFCFEDLGLSITKDIKYSINVCCYYIFILYCLVRGDYNILSDDIKRVSSFILDEDRINSVLSSGHKYYELVIEPRRLNKLEWSRLVRDYYSSYEKCNLDCGNEDD